jgi:hypothetical protein
MIGNKFIRSGQRLLSGPQIFGFTENVEDRVANTISPYIPTPEVTTKVLPVDTLMKPEVPTTPVETFEVSDVPTTQNPQMKPTSDIMPAKMLNEAQVFSSEYITIHKSTLMVVIGIVLAVIVMRMWMQSKRLELIIELQKQQLKNVRG